jgi:hypothetical protein
VRVEAFLRRSWWAIAGVVVVTRLPGFAFGVLNIDESDFVLIGRRIVEGALPYVDIVDHKPPLTYLTFAFGGLFGPASMAPMRVLSIAWILGTLLLVEKAAREWTGDELAGRVAAWLALLANFCELPIVNSEVLMNLPAAAALLWFVRSVRQQRTRNLLLCGACIGLSSLFRHQGAVLAILAVVFLPKLLAPLTMAAGFLLPWAAAAGFYAATGHLAEFNDWVFARNFAYASQDTRAVLGNLVTSLAICIPAVLLPWALAVRETLRPFAPRSRTRTGLLLALWSTWLAVASGGRFYEHYFVQFAPLLGLLAAPLAADLVRRWDALSKARRGAILAAAVLPALGLMTYSFARGMAGQYPAQDPRANAVAAWLRANTQRTDTMFVWGHFSPLFYLAEREAGTRYQTCSVHLGNYDPSQLPPGFDPRQHLSRRDVENTLRDLERNRVPVIVDTAPAGIHGWARMPLSAVPELRDYVGAKYHLAANPGGAQVYLRNGSSVAEAK